MNRGFLRNSLQRHSCIWCLVLLLLALVPIAGGRAASPDGGAARTIRVVLDSNYPPYISIDGDGKIQGILADRWRLWQEKTGIRVEMTALDWQDALAGMKTGRFDVIDTAFVTEERQKWLEFGKPYADIEVSVFFRSNISEIGDIHSLQGFVVGVKEGDAAAELLRSNGIDSLMLFKGYEAMVQAGREHRVNVFVADKPPIIHYLYKHGIRNDFKVSAPINIGAFHRAVKKKNNGLLREIEEGFARISTEELERIDKKWVSQPLLPELPVVPLLVGAGVLGLAIAGLFYWNRTLRAAVIRRTAELENSERALRESEARYRGLVEDASSIILRMDRDGRILFLNEFAQRFFGYTLDEVAGRNLVGTLSPHDLPGNRFWERLAEADGQAGDFVIDESENMRRDGSRVWITWASKALRDPQGRVGEILCVGSDSTDRKLAEEALRRERERLAFVIEGSQIGTWEWNVQTNEVVVNHNWTWMLGYTLSELMPHIGESWRKLVHPDDLERVRASLLRCARDEAADHDREYRMRHKDGHWVWILDRGRVVTRDAAGKPLGMIGIHADISVRKRVEKELLATSELLTQFIKTSPIYALIREVSPAGSTVLKASDNCEEMFGLPVAEMLGKTVNALFPAPFAAKMTADDWLVVTQGEILRLEMELNGRTYTTIKFPIKLGERNLVAGYAIDITERRQAQAALQASEATFRNIVQASPMGIHIYDLLPDGRLVLAGANPAADRLLGLEHSRLVGKTLEEILPAIHATEVPLRFRRAAEFGESWQNERFEYADITIAGLFELHVFQMSPGRMAILFNDISIRKRAEEEKNKLETQLNQARKMESIGQLAGGVAHDFNNMLGVIIGHCELALTGMHAAHPLYATLQSVRQAAERSADLTRQLLAFARKQPVAPEELELNATVAQMLTMLQRLVGEDVDLAWLPSQNAGRVRIDPSQLDQILVNLLVNAKDAVGENGKITIETAAEALDARYCAEHVDGVPGDYVRLAVSDNGCGMSGETLTRLFEPFYTTKELGKGTGLGLATVYGIVKQNGGFVNVYSEPGQGSTFKIYLPRLDNPEEREPEAMAEAEPPAAPSGSETVLLVEDEPMILEITATMLRRLGYTALTASGPEEAVRLAEEHGKAVDLLLTDVVMPGMNGRMLARNLVAANPELKCLFMSGYTANVVAQHGVLDEGVHFIHKPFALNALAAKIREVLEGAGRC
ncbi:MAG: PAS domain S-box protein [Desulfobulbus sp.]|jgi:PAS domain S-box-containing protein|uniref:PAS domain S-box protein n=1 Tax=Desulfobulbus sp. TaxID=895 RepID=UPI00284BCCD5|nr:PAS domain S-box protein [Desulfobulbus sp.]MDR2550145.1 PAS domain S-box protein [Desulfobulbus sp.]